MPSTLEPLLRYMTCCPYCWLKMSTLALAASLAQAHQRGLEPTMNCLASLAKSLFSGFTRDRVRATHGIGDSPKCLPSFP